MLTDLKEANKDTLTDDFVNKMTSNVEKVNAFENAEDTLDSSDSASRASIAAAVKNAYAANGSAGVTTLTNTYASQITTNKTAMEADQEVLDKHAVLSKLVAMDETSAEYATAFADFVSQVHMRFRTART